MLCYLHGVSISSHKPACIYLHKMINDSHPSPLAVYHEARDLMNVIRVVNSINFDRQNLSESHHSMTSQIYGRSAHKRMMVLRTCRI